MKIISGGQTGVDRAALDVAIALDIPHGGWCPKGRLAENNTTIPLEYNLQETDSADFEERTKFNIRDSDATLIIIPVIPNNASDGTQLTINEVTRCKKPFLIIGLNKAFNFDEILIWIIENKITTLNIAGPRESNAPGIYQETFKILKKLFMRYLNKNFRK